MNRRGQGMSINMVVLAALALLVLVLGFYFVNKAGKTVTGGTTCENNGGVCVDLVDGGSKDCSAQPNSNTMHNPVFSCPEKKFCCVKPYDS